MEFENGIEMVVYKIDTSNGWIGVDNPKWKITEWIRPVNFINITKKETVNQIEIFYKYILVSEYFLNCFIS